MKKPSILLIGAGGHCHACIDIIEQENKYEIIGVLDDDPAKQGNNILGYKVIGTSQDLDKMLQDTDHVLITVGQIKSSEVRENFLSVLKQKNVSLPVVQSPFSHVSPHARIGQGTIVMHGVIVNANASVGDGCILNTNALIEHDCAIGDVCHVSTGSVVSGTVEIGDRCFIGSNATLVNNISVCSDTVIAAGSLVRNSIEHSGVYGGNPLKKIS